jgi:hypothetical protein
MEFFLGFRTKAGMILSQAGEANNFVFDNLDKLFDNLEQCTWAHYEKYFMSNQAQIKKKIKVKVDTFSIDFHESISVSEKRQYKVK